MEGTSKQGQDRISIISCKPAETNLKEQPVPPKVVRTPVANRSSQVPKVGPLKDQISQHESSTARTFTNVYPMEQTYYYGGYENNSSNWDDYNYVGANGLQVVPQAMFNENPSMIFHSGYGLDSQVAYGQFSPMANPMSPIMVDGQLFSPHQVPPVSVPYYLPSVSPGLPPVSPALPHVNSSLPVSQPELMTIGHSGQEVHGENMLFGPGYFFHYGALGGVGLPGEPLSHRSSASESAAYIPSLTSPGAVYAQPFGILGSYDHTFGQFPQEQRPFHGLGLVGNSSTRKYASGGSYRSSGYNVAPNDKRDGRFTPDKGVKQERNRVTTYVSTADAHGMSGERNRGPRGSNNLKGKNATEEDATGIGKTIESISDTGCDSYNLGDFTTEYKNAKFFIIKSFSEDNVHKSIKYSVWSSTSLGNKKLDAAYHEAKEQKDPCPVFLLFSVNASGQFCGVAEMLGPVDFENNAEYWQQDRWSGQFPVKWHMLKDVPNGRFRHIILENNENKPVTHSRDSQEVKLKQGIEMIKILKDYNSETSILDDFNFYNEREKMLLGRKNKQQQQSSSKNMSTIHPDNYISQLPDNFSESLHLGDSSKTAKSN